MPIQDSNLLSIYIDDYSLYGFFTQKVIFRNPYIFTPQASKILNDENAGGNSEVSEMVSYDILYATLGAKLLASEMEIDYFPHGSKKTDYIIEYNKKVYGVSVCRGMTYKENEPFDLGKAKHLINKKLNGVIWSSRNIDGYSIEKQIIHILCESNEIAELCEKVYFHHIDKNLLSNTVLIASICEDARFLFVNDSDCIRIQKQITMIEYI